MSDVYYCDDYEAITGKERDGSMPNDPAVETKVVSAPETPAAEPASTVVETA